MAKGKERRLLEFAARHNELVEEVEELKDRVEYLNQQLAAVGQDARSIVSTLEDNVRSLSAQIQHLWREKQTTSAGVGPQRRQFDEQALKQFVLQYTSGENLGHTKEVYAWLTEEPGQPPAAPPPDDIREPLEPFATSVGRLHAADPTLLAAAVEAGADIPVLEPWQAEGFESEEKYQRAVHDPRRPRDFPPLDWADRDEEMPEVDRGEPSS